MMTTRNKKVAAISQAVIQQDTQRDQRTSFFFQKDESKNLSGIYIGFAITLCMTKKREKGEVMITKKIARACKRPVINHLVR